MTDAATLLYDGDVPFNPAQNAMGYSPSTGEYLRATWDNFIDGNNVTYYGIDTLRMGIANIGKPKVSPEDARKQFEKNGIFDYHIPKYGMSQDMIDYVVSYQERQRKRQEIFDRNTSTLNYALSIPTFFAATVTDPAQVASAFIPVIGEARYAKALMGSSILGRTATRAGYGAIEGAAGAIALEPFVGAQQRGLGNDYDITNSLANVVFGGIFGSVAHPVMGGLGDAFEFATKKLRVADALSPITDRLAVLKDTIYRLENDLPSDAERTIARNLVEKGYDPTVVGETMLQGEYGSTLLKEARDAVEAARAAPKDIKPDDLLKEIKKLGGIRLFDAQGQSLPGAGDLVSISDTATKKETLFPKDGRGKTPDEMFNALTEAGWFSSKDAGQVSVDEFHAKLRDALHGTPVEKTFASVGERPDAKITELRKEMKAAGVTAKDAPDVAAQKLATHRAEQLARGKQIKFEELFGKASDTPGNPDAVPADPRSLDQVDIPPAMTDEPIDNSRNAPGSTREEMAANPSTTAEKELAQSVADLEAQYKAMEEEGLIDKEDRDLIAQGEKQVQEINVRQKAWEAVMACMLAHP